MSKIKLLFSVFGYALSVNVYAAKCAPESAPASSVGGMLTISQVSMGVTATAIGGETLDTCGLTVSDTKATVQSADVSIKNINAVGANAISIVNITNGATALGKGTIKGHGFTLKTDSPRQNTMMNSVASIVGVGSMLIAGGEKSEFTPPSGPPRNIRDVSGTVSYNRVDANNTDYLNVVFSKTGVSANQLLAFGGTSMANVDSFSTGDNQSNSISTLVSTQAGDTANSLISTGIKMGDGDAAMGDNGLARANSFTAKNVDIRTTTISRTGNQVNTLLANSGTAAANGVNISDTRNINAVSITMAGNSASMSSVMGIPLRPMSLPETNVTSNNLSIARGEVSASSYAFNANSSNMNQALMGGSVKVNTVNLNESNHTGVSTVLSANTGSNLTALGFSPSGSGTSASGSSSIANSVTHGSRSRATGTAFTLQGNQSQTAFSVMGGKAVDNSVSNGDNAEITGGAISLTGNQATMTTSIGQDADAKTNSFINSSSQSGSNTRVTGSTVNISANTAVNTAAFSGGKSLVNSVSNAGEVSGMVTISNNQSTSAVSMGNDSDLKVNSMSNSGRAMGVLMISNNRNIGSSVSSGSGNVNSIVSGSSGNGMLNGMYSITGNNGMVFGEGNSNSIINKGNMTGVGIVQNNTGSSSMNGTSTSIVNSNTSSTMSGMYSIVGSTGISVGRNSKASSIINGENSNLTGTGMVMNSNGIAMMEGTSTSIVNNGTITGTVAIIGSTGVSMGSGSVASSIVNEGTISGFVGVINSNGSSFGSGTSSSVVNRSGATIGGSAFIVGTNGSAAGGRTHGSVVNNSTASGVGVVGNTPIGGIPELMPNPMISQSIVVQGVARAYIF